MDSIINLLYSFAVDYGLSIIGAIIILIAGRIAAGIARKVTRKVLTKTKTDESIVSFAGNLVYALVLTFAVIGALAKFGIETASFVAILAAASFAVGFALQGSLSNFAAGIMILLFRPYRMGDFIEGAGVSGTVKEIDIFSTTIATPDNIKIIVPNNKIYGDVIKNVSGYDTRRFDLIIGIGYNSSIQKAYDVIMSLIKQDSRVLSEPEPMIAVTELADSSVNLVVRAWVKKEDYWGVKFDHTRKIKEAFDENDIEIPFPQRVVHMMPESKT